MSQEFSIAEVIRHTGLSRHVLHKWERRYGVVSPRRADNGYRRYSLDDVERLHILANAVRQGHTISVLADQPLTRLRALFPTTESPSRGIAGTVELLPQSVSPVARAESEESEECVEVALIGPAAGLLSDIDAHLAAALSGLDATVRMRPAQVASGVSEASVAATLHGASGAEEAHGDKEKKTSKHLLITESPEDIVVLECDTCSTAEAQALQQLAAGRRQQIVVIARYLSRSNAVLLRAGGLICLSPVQAREGLAAQLSYMVKELIKPRNVAPLSISGVVPPRRFSADDVARFAAADAKLDCECPNHLAELVKSLVAFEEYSEQCENASEEEQVLHRFVLEKTAAARAAIEDAMEQVAQFEKLPLEPMA